MTVVKENYRIKNKHSLSELISDAGNTTKSPLADHEVKKSRFEKRKNDKIAKEVPFPERRKILDQIHLRRRQSDDFHENLKKKIFVAMPVISVLFRFQGDSTSSIISSKTESQDTIFNGTLRNEVEYFERLHKTNGSCRKLLSLGGFSCKKYMDGDKRVCLDKHLMPPRNNCLVYSFGVGDDVTFEESLNRLLNCEIHLYDPLNDSSWLQGTLSKNIHYHPIGISSAAKEIPPKGNFTEKLFLTFDKILEDNGHLGRTIHYLKMDIESYEWEVLAYMLNKNLLDNVLQLAMEIHTKHIELLPYSNWLPVLQMQYDILAQLERIGFRRVSYIINYSAFGAIKLPYESQLRPGCGEIFYIRDPTTVKTCLQECLSSRRDPAHLFERAKVRKPSLLSSVSPLKRE
ncbi:uncharacterized protein [Palaemon carinicauda]|uniref:uncharacterized protein n=1 Tax=Palaemon carinicauda TaxID=392227 RepID=UPI0035B59A1C